MATESALYRQLSQDLIAEIESGRLRPGARLPGTRTLAQRLGMSRNTVLAAYNELVVQGWAESSPAMGTFVRRELSEDPRPGLRQRKKAPQGEPALGISLGSAFPALDPVTSSQPKLQDFSSGIPDTRLVPTELIARTYRRVMRRSGVRLLGYGDPRGEESLRRELATLLHETRGLQVGPENIIVTRGAQMALSLLGQVLLKKGDRVLVEQLGYQPAWDTLKRQGARLQAIAVDQQGMQVTKLETMTAVRAVYLTPHHQFPTMALLSPERRRYLLDWAARRRVAIIEDDYDHEFQFMGRPVWPLASTDRSGVVLYVGGLSKVLAPALRVGYIVAPKEIIERAAALRRIWDRQGDRVMETALAELLSLGEIQRHIRKARRCYEARRLALAAALQEQLGSTLSFELSAGGLSIWAEVVDGTDLIAWQEAARKEGLLVKRAADYHYRGRELPFIRLSFASMSEDELTSAVRRLAVARPRS